MIDFSVTRFSETTTGGGQFLNFQCRPEDVERVKELMQLIYKLDFPRQVTMLSHGGYGQPSRYDITQHKYAGGGHGSCGGYIEVLEIKNPPDNRHPFVIFEYYSGRSWFTEWKTIEEAVEVFKHNWASGTKNHDLIPQKPGFIRLVECGALSPWFYAIGDEVLIGDYTFPYGIQDDPVYRFGRKFLVPTGLNDEIHIKTCMGTRFIDRKGDKPYRIIYWDDGTFTNETMTGSSNIRPLEADELWIDESIQQFKSFLNGNLDEFSLDFTNGFSLRSKLTKPKDLITKEGDYELEIYLQGQTKPKTGWRHFSPSEQFGDLLSELQDEAKRANKVIEKITIIQKKVPKNCKKWKGVFFLKNK